MQVLNLAYPYPQLHVFQEHIPSYFRGISPVISWAYLLVFSHQSSHKCPCIYPPYICNSSHTYLL